MALGTLPGGSWSSANAAAGEMIVGVSGVGTQSHAFRWSPATGMVDLGALGAASTALDINPSGIVVGMGDSADNTQILALRWDGSGGITILPALSTRQCRAFGVNGLGNAVGHCTLADGRVHATYWPWAGGILDLHSSGSSTTALDINRTDRIVGQWDSQGFVVTPGHPMQALPPLPGDTLSEAAGINDQGLIVGVSRQLHPTQALIVRASAVLWEDGQPFDLNLQVTPPSACQLEEAVGITEAGLIAAMGRCAGETRAFLLTPMSPTLPPPVSLVNNARDIDNDGRADLAWQQQESGAVAVWFLDGPRVAGSAALPRVADRQWRLVATGDMDGDGQADIVWWHPAGQLALWFCQGTTVLRSRTLQADQAWQAAAVADLNRDGYADIVWRHRQTGAVAVWLMQGEAFLASLLIMPASDLAYTLVTAGDIDEDGHPDLVFRQAQTGTVVAWRLNGPGFAGSGLVTEVEDPHWHLVAVGDVNGDGFQDFLWQHAMTGQVATWLRQAATFHEAARLGQVDPGWVLH